MQKNERSVGRRTVRLVMSGKPMRSIVVLLVFGACACGGSAFTTGKAAQDGEAPSATDDATSTDDASEEPTQEASPPEAALDDRLALHDGGQSPETSSLPEAAPEPEASTEAAPPKALCCVFKPFVGPPPYMTTCPGGAFACTPLPMGFTCGCAFVSNIPSRMCTLSDIGQPCENNTVGQCGNSGTAQVCP
jgi:hypothetical protein